MIATRILFNIPNFITAGSGRAMINVIERLDRTRFSPFVGVLKRGGKLEASLEQMGVPLLQFPFAISPRPYSSLPIRVWKAAKAAKQVTNFSIWHSFHYADDYTEALIAYASGAKAWMFTKKNMGWGSRAWRVRSRLAKAIAMQNTSMSSTFFPHCSEKVHYVPPGVDSALYSPGDQDPAMRESFGFPDDAFIFVHVAQLVPVKNHPHLLRALARTATQCCLVLVGDQLDPDYSASLRSLVSELGLENRVRFHGKEADVPRLLRSVDAFVFSSHREACPVAALEAMSSGLCSVVTGIPAMLDIHVPEVTGVVVPVGDVEAFAESMQRIREEPCLRRSMGTASRERVKQKFTLDAESTRYQEIYRSLIEQ